MKMNRTMKISKLLLTLLLIAGSGWGQIPSNITTSNPWQTDSSGNVAISATVSATNLPVPVKGTPDGAIFMDGAISASSATFSSASTTFTSADVGKLILIHGAGAAGASLATTIAGYTSAHVVTLAAVAGTTVAGSGTCPGAGCGAYGTDNATAIATALATIPGTGDSAAGGIIGFSRGIYLTSAEILIQKSYVTLQGTAGGSTIIYAGSGAVTAVVHFEPTAPDGNCLGGVAGCLNGSGLRDIAIRGSSLSSNAVYTRASHRMHMADVFLADATTCMTTAFNVLSEYNSVICSNNMSQAGAAQGGFLRTPTTGVTLAADASTGQSIAGTFTNLIIERVSGVGLNMTSAANNTFISGSSEGNGGVGVSMAGSINRNVFIGMDFEANTTADILLTSGSYNQFITINSDSLVHLVAPGNTIFSGGQFVNITIDSGAGDTRLDNVTYTGTLTNSSVSTYQKSVCKGPCAGGLTDDQTNITFDRRGLRSLGLSNVGDYGNSVPYLGSFFGTNTMGIDMGSGLLFGGRYNSSSSTAFGGVICKKLNATDGNYSGYCDVYARVNGSVPAPFLRIDRAGAGAGDTTISIWDVDAAAFKRVSIGAADSCGTGYKCLRVAN